MALCARCHSRYWEGSDPSRADPRGAAFAERLLFVKWVSDDGYYGAHASWVSDCPDGVEPRSAANPHVYTWSDTVQEDWGAAAREHWYIVGARGERSWVGIDVDVDEAGHEEVVGFDTADLSFHERALVALSKSGGPHIYVLTSEDPPMLGTGFDGVDLLSDHGNVRQAGAVSPWHDGRRAVLSDPEPYDHHGQLAEDPGEVASVAGVPILRERERGEAVVDLDLPDEAPSEVPRCVSRLLMVRSSHARNRYPGSPWKADTHLGQMLVACGYPMDEAMALLRDHPPAKEGGFDEGVSRRHMERLYAKMDSGGLHPPVSKLAEAGIDVGACECAVHGDSGRGEASSLSLPRMEPKRGGASEADARELSRARRDVRRTLRQPVDGGLVYHAPQGLGKTKHAAAGASEQPRLVVTSNKGEHRDTLKHFADRFGVTWDEVVPFSESWLCSSESPVADEVESLYRQGVWPKYILPEYRDLIPDRVDDPYVEQFDGGPPSAGLLMGSPGHETVPRFRMRGTGGDDAEERAVVYDDVSPADREIDENAFSLDGARAELNELLQEVPELESDSVSELLRDAADRRRVERVAISNGAGDDDGDGGGPDDGPADVWGALEAAAAEDDAIRVDLVDVVRRRENVRGDTIVKLKVVAGAEVEGVTPLSWESGGDDMHCWVTHPDLSDHDVALLSATHLPHVTERWFARARAGPAEHRTAARDWKAVRRAQGYRLLQTRAARNSRSGAGAYSDDPAGRRERMRGKREALRDAIRRAEGEDPGVIDSKRLLDGDGMNFGRVWSNNEYRDRDVGLVAGATYFGDEWVEARAAYCGRQVEVEHEPGEPARCGDRVGRDLLSFMVRTTVEQAVTRFGRSTDGETTVYVDTRETPADFPVADISGQIVRTTETERKVHGAVAGGAGTLEEIDDEVGVTRRHVSNVVWSLEEAGLLDVDRLALENGAHDVALSGDGPISLSKVELPEVETPGAYTGQRAEAEPPDSGEAGRNPGQGRLGDFVVPPG
jgi:hypothetical protein